MRWKNTKETRSFLQCLHGGQATLCMIDSKQFLVRRNVGPHHGRCLIKLRDDLKKEADEDFEKEKDVEKKEVKHLKVTSFLSQ